MYDPDEFLERKREKLEMDESKMKEVTELRPKLNLPNGNLLQGAEDQKRIEEFCRSLGYVKAVVIGLDIKGGIAARGIATTLIDSLGLCEIAKNGFLRGNERK